MKKFFLLGTMVCVLGMMTASCTRVKNKIVSTMSSEMSECKISSLYPDLNDDDCVGLMNDDIFYNYYFRYKASPSDVENALLAKECSFVEIKPDTALIPRSEKYILSEIKMLSEETYPEFVEWRWAENPDNLLFFECIRTPLRHFLVFDTSTGYVYHYISEFRE